MSTERKPKQRQRIHCTGWENSWCLSLSFELSCELSWWVEESNGKTVKKVLFPHGRTSFQMKTKQANLLQRTLCSLELLLCWRWVDIAIWMLSWCMKTFQRIGSTSFHCLCSHLQKTKREALTLKAAQQCNTAIQLVTQTHTSEKHAEDPSLVAYSGGPKKISGSVTVGNEVY